MKKTIVISILVFFFCGCDRWLNVQPESERPSEAYWEKKEDVHNTMMSAYVRLRECLPKILQWGELRADVLNVRATDANLELTKVKNQDITSESPVVQWTLLYRVINSANAVIAYAPLVQEKDPIFLQEDADQYIAEAKIVRSLAYFYLVRAFREVPLVTKPYMTDAQGIDQPKATEREILDQITLDLVWSLKRAKTSYATSSVERWQNKGRVTRWTAQTLLADIYLWDEKYQECAAACEVLVKSAKFRLLGDDLGEEEDEDQLNKENWYWIFYPGLSDESIFELCFDHINNQKNDLFNWFKDGGIYEPNPVLKDEFEMENGAAVIDRRGSKASYFTENSKFLFWKYLGTKNDGSSKRTNDNLSPNWIFYRYADVLLIQAEAYAMLGDKKKALDNLNIIKRRAGVPALAEEFVSESEETFSSEILKERKKEFVGEGKRWFDLLRFAKKENFSKYKTLVMKVLLNNIPMAERPIYEQKLANDWSFFFPIDKKQIDMSDGLLVQNPAYQ